MDISKDIQAVIEQQLPAAVGEVLRKRLEQAESDAKDLIKLSRDYELQSKRVLQMEENILKYQQEMRDHAALDIRERTIAERERDLKVTILETQLAAANDKAEFAKNTALGLVRNTEFRQQALGSNSKNIPNPHGGTFMAVDSTSSTTQGSAT